VVDDERLIRWSIGKRLTKEGLEALDAADARSCLARAPEADVIVLDYKLPDADGFEVLRRLRRERPEVPVIMLTAHASVDHAVEAMKLGAYHYVGKPYELDTLSRVIHGALHARSRDERASEAPTGRAALVGDSAQMQRVRARVDRVARSPSSTVLITGESGTGKTLVARVIHAESARRDGPFVPVTCSAIPEALFESELFGHERGAFTGAERPHAGLVERAHGGTLLLDEIGEMPLLMQSKLLRLIEDKRFRRVGAAEERSVDTRIIAATNVHLREAVREARFRSDLYYRLAVMDVHVPPLRERPDDLPALVDRILEQLADELGVRARLRRGALGVLRSRPWPGNVRELRNELERAVLLMEGESLGPEDLDAGDLDASGFDPDFVLPPSGVDMEDVERALLEQALMRSGGNQRKAGEMLGMNRDQVRYRMAKYGIPSRRTSPSDE